jgi:hypothetical protein
MVRHGVLVVAVAVLSLTTTGCLAVYSTRPVEVVVTREDTGEPVADLPISVTYGYMLVANPPTNTHGSTDASGRVVLTIADFDSGSIHLQAGDFGSSIRAEKVRAGGPVTTARWSDQAADAPKVRMQLVSDKRSLLERLCGKPPRFEPTPVTVAELERKIDRALPVGSTKQKIEEWLVFEGLEFSYIDRKPSTVTSDLRDLPNADKYHRLIVSIIRDNDRSLLVRESIQLNFLLDEKDRLADRVEKRVLTGP